VSAKVGLALCLARNGRHPKHPSEPRTRGAHLKKTEWGEDAEPPRHMGRQSPRHPESANRVELVQGTLDMLILKMLRLGPLHGQAIATAIERSSEDLFKIDHGSLCPALQRLQQEGWISASWGTSPNNRRAKFYTLTIAEKKAYRSRVHDGSGLPSRSR
jgi:PadR family transcriptional regulator, regulatory protein PadR